jgi:hypothetical protein
MACSKQETALNATAESRQLLSAENAELSDQLGGDGTAQHYPRPVSRMRARKRCTSTSSDERFLPLSWA